MPKWEPEVTCSNGYTCSKETMHVRDNFRLLWRQHAYWTRMVIISIAYDLPNSDGTVNRLLRNASDFARLFYCFYRHQAAFEFERLLKDHIAIGGKLLKATKAGNGKAAADAEKRWYENGDEIACFLNYINPYWSVKHMREMWYKHLELIKGAAIAELNKKYVKSIETSDEIESEALIMADDFSSGVICQFCL